MKQEIRKYNAILVFFVIFLISVQIVFADGDGYLYMSEEDCRITCEDEEEGYTYTVAMSAKVSNDGDGSRDGQTNGGCGLEVYDYLYQDDTIIYQELLASIDESEMVGGYGGYLTLTSDDDEDHQQQEEKQTTYGRGFMTLLLSEALRVDILWKLLYTSYITLTSDDETNTLTATYTHQINPCPVPGNYVEIHAMCDDSGWNWRGVAVGCRIYKDGEMTPLIDKNIDGNQPDASVQPDPDDYTYYYQCENDGDAHDRCERY